LLPTPFRTEDAVTTAPLGGALGQDAAEMCIFERNGYDSERDYCIPEDESGNPEGVYVSLVNNPERFTGYAGEHAHAVWREIYRENCFEMQVDEDTEVDILEKGHSGPMSPAMSDLEAVMSGRTQRQRVSGATVQQEYNQLQLENTCLEKRVFWRLISGMHTSISTHLCWDYLNQSTGEWVYSPSSILISGTQSRMFQISSLGLSSMDRKFILQLRRRSPRRHKTIELPRLIHLLFRRSNTRHND
jgi:ERO1-like protein beta